MYKTCLIYSLLVTMIKTENIIITIPDGKLRGTVMTNYDGGKFYGFTRVPYAKPPLGELRYKLPEQNKPWNGILDATKPSPDCIQPNIAYTSIIGQEDCLYLRIFTNSTNRNSLKPVMTYTYGGKFFGGSPNDYGPEFLMTQDIVLVILNYRLGVYGFMNTMYSKIATDNQMFGNNGLKDQVLALKWIQRNIEYFGGDTKRVTIVGHSVGGVSVHALVLSPLSTGLFQRAMPMGATALTIHVQAANDTATPIAKYLGLNTTNYNAMMQGLRNATNEELFNAAQALKWFEIQLNSPCLSGLVIEKPSANSFISDYPLNIIKQGKYKKVPLMFGNANKEGLIIYGKEYELPGYKYFDTHIPFFFQDKNEAKDKIRKFYNFSSKVNHSNLIDFYTYDWYKYSIFRTAREHAKIQKEIYYYEFAAVGKMNFMKSKMPSIQKEYGACHGDELGYLFMWNGLPIKGSFEEKLMRSMVQMWVNFIKGGKPVDIMNNFQTDVYSFLNISNDGVKFMTMNDKSLLFWDELYKNYSKGFY